MVRITYPKELKCPSCKSVIRLDYSGKYTAATDDLLVMMISVPCSTNSAKDMRKNKQDIGTGLPSFVICQSCQTILGTT
ncbi:MAG: hypothetical protein JSW11_14895 [Candidatus Heimdallarchaeota archaeon]|nr:MAG: hypothetical protein JSW11_14895 [Candidatus Heimdallarchaeota archaeon]